MRVGVSIIKAANKIFPAVKHPFNMQSAGEMSYARWQYEKGADTVKCYLPKYHADDIFAGKTVLDMGCGAAGKCMYYLSQGAERVVGVDIVPRYEQESMKFARELGYESRFSFVLASAYDLPYANGSFDTIIMNDFMEHVDRPEDALREAVRLLSPKGRIFVNFPPYYHPTGAHMSDVIYMPWVQLFFSERTLCAAYRELCRGLPDESERVNLRISVDDRGRDYIGYINKMTLARFKKILRELEITPEWYSEIPLRSYFALLAKIPGIKELFVKMAVCVISRESISQTDSSKQA